MPNKLSASLVCHPATPCAALAGIAIELTDDAQALTLRYVLTGDIADLRIPALRPAERKDELWRQTCCELFLASSTDPRYCEFNFSPSSEWAAYRFDSYRQGMRTLPLSNPPHIDVSASEGQWALEATLKLGSFDLRREEAKKRLALSAVIEETDGRFSYWALKHPAGQPDFHHRDGFALEL